MDKNKIIFIYVYIFKRLFVVVFHNQLLIASRSGSNHGFEQTIVENVAENKWRANKNNSYNREKIIKLNKMI